MRAHSTPLRSLAIMHAFNFTCNNTLQIDQELGLICGKSDVKAQFLTRWSNEYVPAILTYGRRSTKKAFPARWWTWRKQVIRLYIAIYVMSSCIIVDQTSKEVTALKILSECLAKGRVSLCYVYEEYTVFIILVILIIAFSHRKWIVLTMRVVSCL